jgi:hypothetical protein
VTSRVGEVSGARAVGLGVYRSTNSTRPQTAARLIGLRSTRSTHERRGVCEIGRVDGVYDGNERARLRDQKSVRADSAKVIAKPPAGMNGGTVGWALRLNQSVAAATTKCVHRVPARPLHRRGGRRPQYASNMRCSSSGFDVCVRPSWSRMRAFCGSRLSAATKPGSCQLILTCVRLLSHAWRGHAVSMPRLGPWLPPRLRRLHQGALPHQRMLTGTTCARSANTSPRMRNERSSIT